VASDNGGDLGKVDAAVNAPIGKKATPAQDGRKVLCQVEAIGYQTASTLKRRRNMRKEISPLGC